MLSILRATDDKIVDLVLEDLSDTSVWIFDKGCCINLNSTNSNKLEIKISRKKL